MFADHRWFEDEREPRLHVHHCECGVRRIRIWPSGATQPVTTYFRDGQVFATPEAPCPRLMA